MYDGIRVYKRLNGTRKGIQSTGLLKHYKEACKRL